MRLKLGTGGPPLGNYEAVFAGVEETDHEQWGAGLRWMPRSRTLSSNSIKPRKRPTPRCWNEHRSTFPGKRAKHER